MKPHRVAFVGLGRVADVHYAALQAAGPRARLAAVCDVRAEAVEQRKQQWGVPGFTSFEELLRSVEVDAVCLFLPHDVHLEFVTLASRFKKPIFLEKPIAISVEEAQRINGVCRDAGVRLMVAHNGLFHPAFERMVALVRAGLIGRPLFAQARSTQWLDFRPWDFRLSSRKTGGGAWMDCAGHLVYRLREVFGEVADVSGMTGNLVRAEMEGEDFASAVLRYESGAMAQITVSYGLKLPGYEHDWPQGCEQSLLISGDRGAVEYAICPHPSLRLFSEVEGGRSPALQGWIVQETPEPFEFSFVRQLAHFLDCLDSGEEARVTGGDAIETLKVLRALYDKLSDAGGAGEAI
ncbi:MAG: Gfo/Idh/MocA family oxidoreductase [Terrimicrobiaceae bacterium]|nr:Gfo/Idh/MocA family oxidoreductase [Terrimicrobiaceae bacterium]